MCPFETSIDIVENLRAQWAGLFQRVLQQQARASEVQLIEELTSSAKTLRELVTFLTEERANKDEAIRNILLASHPAFRRFAEVAGVHYRVFFTNEAELNAWLKARTWTAVPKENWDSDSVAEWVNADDTKYMKVTVKLFDRHGRLRVFTEDEWKNEWVQVGQVATG
jgi:hypothetical protein